MLSNTRQIAWINLQLKVTRIISQNKFIVFIFCVICVLTIFTQLRVLVHKQANMDITNDLINGTSFILIGDWGIVEKTNNDFENKLKLAKAMSIIQKQYNTSFIISVGDQYYDNGIHLQYPLQDLETSDDLNYWFINHFENVFDKSLSDWYLILGNHDMRGSVHALLKYNNISQRWNMPFNYYFKDFPIAINNNKNNNLFRVLFIDTTSIMCDNEDRSDLDSLESWSCDEAWYNIKSESKSKYNEKDNEKFVARDIEIQWIKNVIHEAHNNDEISVIFIVGHHCLWSNGPHGCPKVMGKHMRPLFELSHKIKAYFCGHNHGLEHFKWTMNGDEFKVNTFLSGAGACLHAMNDGRCKFDALVDSEDDRDEQIELKYLAVERGFMTFHFQFNGHDIHHHDIVVKFWDYNAQKIYEAII